MNSVAVPVFIDPLRLPLIPSADGALLAAYQAQQVARDGLTGFLEALQSVERDVEDQVELSSPRLLLRPDANGGVSASLDVTSPLTALEQRTDAGELPEAARDARTLAQSVSPEAQTPLTTALGGVDSEGLNELPLANPTESALLQSYIGGTAGGQGLQAGAAANEGAAPLRVAGVDPAAALGAFTNEQASASNAFELTSMPSRSRMAPAPVPDEFSGIYDATTGQVVHRIGMNVDMRG